MQRSTPILAGILAVLGPGLISGFADNDAGGITTYSAGARFGYGTRAWNIAPAATASRRNPAAAAANHELTWIRLCVRPMLDPSVL